MATQLLVLGAERTPATDGAISGVVEPGTCQPMAEVAS
jgi:hypothetical protein